MSHILSLDLGTTYFKAALFDADGRLLAVRRTATPTRRDRQGRCEISVSALRNTITELVRELSTPFVRAISFTTQANSFTLLDAHDEPLTPLILWTDDRLPPARGVGDIREVAS